MKQFRNHLFLVACLGGMSMGLCGMIDGAFEADEAQYNWLQYQKSQRRKKEQSKKENETEPSDNTGVEVTDAMDEAQYYWLQYQKSQHRKREQAKKDKESSDKDGVDVTDAMVKWVQEMEKIQKMPQATNLCAGCHKYHYNSPDSNPLDAFCNSCRQQYYSTQGKTHETTS